MNLHFIVKKIKKCMTVIFLFLLFLILIFFFMLFIGKYQLKHRLSTNFNPSISEEERFYFSNPLYKANPFCYDSENALNYKDQVYNPNNDLLILYFMGIDEDTPVQKKNTSEGGQADTHILVLIDLHKKTIQLLTINRNSMTDIDIYDMNDSYGYTIPGQLCLQHAYGDGMEESCIRSKEALQRYLYNVPIHGYVSLQKGIIATLNDAIGGVEVTALEDIIFPEPETIIHKDENIKLLGSNAYYYLTFRYIENFGSNNTRLERQQQYMNAFISQMTKACQKNILLPYIMYQKASNYMVTDLSLPELLYLSYIAFTYKIDSNMYSLPGTTESGELYECFYADPEALTDMILKYFYTR